MTLDEAAARAAALVDEQIEIALDRAEIMLLDHGATPDEVRDFLARYTAELAAWRADFLAALPAELRNFDDPVMPPGKLRWLN